MRPLPVYRIAPPDILEIEVLKLVPPRPYRASIYDTHCKSASWACCRSAHRRLLSGRRRRGRHPWAGLWEGPSGGHDRREAHDAIRNKLKEVVTRPEVSVQLAHSVGAAAVTGQYLVAPDGTVNLGQYGMVLVMGKTVEEAKTAVEKQLSKYFCLARGVRREGQRHTTARCSTSLPKVPDRATTFAACPSRAAIRCSMRGRSMDCRRSPARNNVYFTTVRANPAKGKILPIDYVGITSGGHGHKLSDPAGRPLVHRRRQNDCGEQLAGKEDRACRAGVGLDLVGGFNRRNVERLLPNSSDDPSVGEEPDE